MRNTLVLSFATLVAITACDGQEHGTAPPWATNGPAPPTPAGAAPTPAAPGAPAPGTQAPLPGQAAPAAEAARTALLNDLRTRKFKNEDFVESDTNRDPFRCFLTDFSGGPTIDSRQYDIVLSKYSLDELKLSMITSPRSAHATSLVKRQKNDADCDVRPCAVFVDSAGQGVAVSRNFHISKADAKVVRIDPDKGQVFVEIKEDLGNGKFRMLERVLEMHQVLEGQNQ